MGTRSLTTVYDSEKTPILTFYAQYDGYPEGVGLDIARFLASSKIVNGFTQDGRQFNGVEDLAAQLLCHFKVGKDGTPQVGNVYVFPLRVVDGKLAPARDCGEDYTYEVEVTAEGKIVMRCFREGYFMFGMGGQSDGEHKRLFQGTPQSFIKKYGKKAEAEVGVAAPVPA